MGRNIVSLISGVAGVAAADAAAEPGAGGSVLGMFFF